MGYDVLLPRKNVADTSALGGTDRVPSVGEAWQSDRDKVRCRTGVGGMTAVSRGLGLVSRETNGEASAGSAP